MKFKHYIQTLEWSLIFWLLRMPAYMAIDPELKRSLFVRFCCFGFEVVPVYCLRKGNLFFWTLTKFTYE